MNSIEQTKSLVEPQKKDDYFKYTSDPQTKKIALIAIGIFCTLATVALLATTGLFGAAIYMAAIGGAIGAVGSSPIPTAILIIPCLSFMSSIATGSGAIASFAKANNIRDFSKIRKSFLTDLRTLPADPFFTQHTPTKINRYQFLTAEQEKRFIAIYQQYQAIPRKESLETVNQALKDFADSIPQNPRHVVDQGKIFQVV